MKNFVQEGDILTVVAPAAVLSGAGVLVGTIFGIAQTDAASGSEVAIKRKGVFTHAKTSAEAWTIGAKVYWDNTAKVCTTTVGTNVLIGVAVKAVGGTAGETIGQVRLNATF